MSNKQKKMLGRILVSLALLILLSLWQGRVWLPFPVPFLSVSHVNQGGEPAFSLAQWALFLVPYLIAG